MSKIYVDEMPKCSDDCPFTSNRILMNGNERLDCCSLKGYDRNPCALEVGYECEWLMELPKGDKDNGSSEDK